MLISEIFQNKIILIPVITVLISQIIKVLILIIKKQKVKLKEAIWLTSMPSSHAAFFTALVIAVAIQEGIDSPLFGITLIFSLAYIFDLMLVFKILLIGKVKKLEGKLGHSFFEIIVGIIIGVIISLLLI
jgi:acid phosphatase family membrane protein YuiD